MSGICSAHQGHDPECPRCWSSERIALRAALGDSMRLLDSLIRDGTLTGYQAERATGRILEARQALGKGAK